MKRNSMAPSSRARRRKGTRLVALLPTVPSITRMNSSGSASHQAYAIHGGGTDTATLASSWLEGISTAYELLVRQRQRCPIYTFCDELDKVMGGGVPLAQLTEFCGMPGIGKTQMGIQLCVDVQIPRVFGGPEGSAVFIDTEGSFMVERVVQVAAALSRHLQRMTSMHSAEDRAAAAAVTLESILSRIHYYRVTDFVEQMALLRLLPDFLRLHPEVKLVVLDSVAFHCRYNFGNMTLRTQLLTGMAQQLQTVAETLDVAVVLTNQMTTRFRDQGGAVLVPSLGQSWSHVVSNRIALYWKGGVRHAQVVKSPTMIGVASVPFVLSSAGVRGMPSAKRKRQSANTSNAQPLPTPPAAQQQRTSGFTGDPARTSTPFNSAIAAGPGPQGSTQTHAVSSNKPTTGVIVSTPHTSTIWGGSGAGSSGVSTSDPAGGAGDATQVAVATVMPVLGQQASRMPAPAPADLGGPASATIVHATVRAPVASTPADRDYG